MDEKTRLRKAVCSARCALDWLQSGGLIFYVVGGARAIDSEIYPIDAYGPGQP